MQQRASVQWPFARCCIHFRPWRGRAHPPKSSIVHLNESPIPLSIIQNLLLGTAIGDAYGAGVEFHDRNRIRAEVDFSRFFNWRDQIPADEKTRAIFTDNYHAWDYTDDTEMTIGLIRALMSGLPFTEDLLVEEWKAEYERGIHQKGYGRNGHGSMSWYYSGEKTIEEIRGFQRHRSNPGNAPAMRAAVLGLLPEHLIQEYAAINANATHPHPHAVMSSRCIALAARWMLVLRGIPSEVIRYCMAHVALDEDFAGYLHRVDALGSYESLEPGDWETLCGPQPIVAPWFLPGIEGMPSDSKFTTGCALYVLKHSATAMDALRMSVHTGGDVDSLASITTGILAGREGLHSLPDWMIQQVEGKDYLMQLAVALEVYLNNFSLCE
jgi:ADP-ribosylglycohydrolase